MTAEIQALREALDDHVRMCEKEFASGEAEFQELRQCIQENTETVNEIKANTDEIVTAWRDMKGAISVWTIMQRAGLWVIKWPIIGAGIYTMWKWLTNNLP
jgi:hypothetical protein